MRNVKIIIIAIILSVVIMLTLRIVFITTNDRMKQTNEIYPDSIQVLTIKGDTATIYNWAGHRMLKVKTK